MTKKEIRRLAEDVNEIMEQHSFSNYMNSLMGPCEDYGPNFKPLIEKWKLTREMLLEATEMAYQFSITFDREIAKHTSTNHCPPWNKWQDTYYNFNAIFQAGELN